MMYEEAMRECLARGLRRVECADIVGDRMVAGVYCDGTIVMSESGTRCVPRATVDRVLAARAASPLVRAPSPAERFGTVAGVGIGSIALLVGGAVAVWLLLRD